MRRAWRWVRGVAGTALWWGFCWGAVFTVINLVWFLLSPVRGSVGDFATVAGLSALFWSTWGGVTGAAYGVVFSIAERRRRLEELSVKRAAKWGMLAGLVLPVVSVVGSPTE